MFPPLHADTHADVVVVGGGITGLTAVYLLAAEGRAVVLLERGRCVRAETAHTSAHLTMVTDVPLTRLVDDLGDSRARATWDSGLAAIARVEAIVREEQIDCGFERVPGYFHASRADEDKTGFATAHGSGRPARSSRARREFRCLRSIPRALATEAAVGYFLESDALDRSATLVR